MLIEQHSGSEPEDRWSLTAGEYNSLADRARISYYWCGDGLHEPCESEVIIQILALYEM